MNLFQRGNSNHLKKGEAGLVTTIMFSTDEMTNHSH